MCGIAGIVDLQLDRTPAQTTLKAMGDAIFHRGPDQEGFYVDKGVGLVSRRLSIVGVSNGQQPVFNEDRSVVAVFNGEIYDHKDIRARLEARGHHFRTDADSELLVHLWEDHGDRLFEHINGQFAFALYDTRKKVMIMARDRFGICPLHWTRQQDSIYFGSEIKALLATGKITPQADVRGIDQIMTMFALPTRRTPFKDIHSVYPGSFVEIKFGDARTAPQVSERRYWDYSFPDQGDEYRPKNSDDLIDGFRDKFSAAVARRLEADVPVAAYLSGGIDSSIVCATAGKILGRPIQAYSIKIDSPFFDEEQVTRRNAEAIGCPVQIVHFDSTKLLDRYQQLVIAAEAPVVDTSCASLHKLSSILSDDGYKVTLTGEGSDEGLAGYPWFKFNKLLNCMDKGRFRPSSVSRWLIAKAMLPGLPEADRQRLHKSLGGPVAQADMYSLVSASRRQLLSKDVQKELGDYCAFDEVELDKDAMRRWHPLNRSLYVGYKTQLSGMLLSQKSDRVAMANSVEARYPFLDEEVVRYMSTVPPEWKLKGLMKDKHVLRRAAEGLLPHNVAHQPKKMFRAPFGDTVLLPNAGFVDQLLSEESISKAGYFCPQAVQKSLQKLRQKRRSPMRMFDEMALVGIFSTQLWHHTFIDQSLCDLPGYVPSPPRATDEPVKPQMVS